MVVFIGGMLSSISLLQFATENDSNVLFVDGAPKLIIIDVTNTGASSIIINSAKVNADSVAIIFELPVIITVGDSANLVLEADWVAGNKYKIEIFSIDGDLVGSYQATSK